MKLTQGQAIHAAAMYTALAAGKECQRQAIGNATWYPWYGDTIQPARYTYRVKPEPEPVVNEWWICLTEKGAMWAALHTEEAAAHYVNTTALAKEVVHVVRADSIKIADLVTDEQIERAHWTVRWGARCALPSLKAFIETLDAVREGK